MNFYAKNKKYGSNLAGTSFEIDKKTNRIIMMRGINGFGYKIR